MTPLQSHILTSAITAILTAAITYFILTRGETSIPAEDPDKFRTEERMKLRDEQVSPKAVKDSLEATKERIGKRGRVRVPRAEKMQQMEAERVNKADSVLGVELKDRIKQWRP